EIEREPRPIASRHRLPERNPLIGQVSANQVRPVREIDMSAINPDGAPTALIEGAYPGQIDQRHDLIPGPHTEPRRVERGGWISNAVEQVRLRQPLVTACVLPDQPEQILVREVAE